MYSKSVQDLVEFEIVYNKRFNERWDCSFCNKDP